MKKLLSLLLALAMIFCLAACGSEDTENDSNVPTYSQGLLKSGMYDITALDYVSLPEYLGVDFGSEFFEVSDEDIQSQLDTIASNYGTTSQVTNRAIVSGDQVNIDYSGSIDGEVFDGGTATGQTVQAGGSNFIDDFLDQIIGHIPGEEFTIQVTFPDPYENDESLSGKDADFAIKVNYIEEKIPAEITDDFVAEHFSENYDVKTVDELKAYISESILESNQSEAIDDYLMENSVVTSVPDTVFNHQRNCIEANYQDTAANYGIDADTLASYYGAESLEELINDAEEEIVQMSMNVMIYQALGEDMKIEIKNTDVADYFEEMTGSRDYSTYQTAYGLPYLKFVCMVDKVTDAIIDSAVK